jgi:hypothetical protein
MIDQRAEAQRWLVAEPDDDLRDELVELLAGCDEALAERFTGRLQFGTAGLRAAVGAGPQRMNRLVVRQAAAGLVDHLLRTLPDAAERGVLIGYDARRKSDVFALDTARVCAAKGVRALVFDHVVPTPVLAWNITQVGAAAGVMVTASHNPPADNGYKVYLGTGAQIVPPADTEIAARIDDVDACAVRCLVHPFHEILVAIVDRAPRTEILASLALRRAARGGEYRMAKGVRQLDCTDANAARAALHEQGFVRTTFAATELASVEHVAPYGEVILGQGGRLDH